MNGFERRKEQKKEDIRRSAMALFSSHGISRVSLKDVAVKASVSPASIYNHFGSKQGLVHDVVKWHITDIVTRYKTILKGSQPFMQKLEMVVFDKRNMMRNYNTEFIQTVISQDPEIKNFFEDTSSEMVKDLSIFMEQGREEGCINPELSQEALLLYFDVLRKGIIANSQIFNSQERNEELVRQFTEIYLYGLMGREGKKSAGQKKGARHGRNSYSG